ncbi:hypothetical protein [Vibrio ezurae]|uniref:hypothetical protein n=1 Tax=Vibrio ezurae TaxID=252583 RepID=UPI0005954207|nr:hypothetical protein [Vibrio ezurae]
MPQSRETRLNHITLFLRYTFDIIDLDVSEDSTLHKLARVHDANVGAGRIFCDSNGDGNISDQGLINLFAWSEGLSKTMGKLWGLMLLDPQSKLQILFSKTLIVTATPLVKRLTIYCGSTDIT